MAHKLNDTIVKTLGPGLYWDGNPKAATGFLLRVYGSGKRTFFLNYRMPGGAGRRTRVGNWPTFTYESASGRAHELRREIEAGRDPLAAKREARDTPTVEDLAQRYIDDVMPGLGKNSPAKRRAYRESDTKNVLADVVKRLGRHTAVVSIHHGDVAASSHD